MLLLFVGRQAHVLTRHLYVARSTVVYRAIGNEPSHQNILRITHHALRAFAHRDLPRFGRGAMRTIYTKLLSHARKENAQTPPPAPKKARQRAEHEPRFARFNQRSAVDTTTTKGRCEKFRTQKQKKKKNKLKEKRSTCRSIDRHDDYKKLWCRNFIDKKFFFSTEIFFSTNFFLTRNFFLSRNFFDTKFFSHKKFFNPKIDRQPVPKRMPNRFQNGSKTDPKIDPKPVPKSIPNRTPNRSESDPD